MRLITALCCAALLAAGGAPAQVANSPRPIPATPAAVHDILYARPFSLSVPYRNDWSRERGLVTTGTLVVLSVDPALVVPRDIAEPVLYAGDRPVQRLNHGDRSGRVIGIVPGLTDVSGLPFWFGRPDLPERITPETARAERARADAAGVRPPPAARVRAVLRPRLNVRDVPALLRTEAAELVLRYSPEDKDLAAAWRLPVARPHRNKRQ